VPGVAGGGEFPPAASCERFTVLRTFHTLLVKNASFFRFAHLLTQSAN
jgi:hypothetical protein